MQCYIEDQKPGLPLGHKSSYLTARARAGKFENKIVEEVSLENDNSWIGCAVAIRNVCKRYDSSGPQVLQNLCMNVKKGTIYGLLGSSGCGKTTILSCIVGLQKCDSGDVLVFGRRPGTKGSGIPGRRLGYMPQERALYTHLTIGEILQYFGRIYGMTSAEIKEQWAFLNSFLNLPVHFKLIGSLSGGQQRRTSLALALLHSPELLILDEPTVGLDPLLRRSIWDHLHNLVLTMGTTMIITTHYIEEARHSNTIGVMRNGRLLVEDTPSNLLSHYNCSLLEQIVLKLCRRDEKESNQKPVPGRRKASLVIKSSHNLSFAGEQFQLTEGVFQKATFDCELPRKVDNKDIVFRQHIQENVSSWTGAFHTIHRIYGLTTVILLTYIRNPIFLVMTSFMPAMQGIITLLTVGSIPRGMHLGIVNHELTNWTLDCDMSGQSTNSCDIAAPLSCKFLHVLQKDGMVYLNSYQTEEEALAQVELGRIWGYLRIPDNYSQHTLDLAVSRQFAMNDSIEGSQIHVHLDSSHLILVLYMIRHLYYSYVTYATSLAAFCGIDAQQARSPLLFRTPVYGKDEDDVASFIIPGLVLITTIAVGYALTGVMLVSDRKQGTLSRSHVAGLATGDVFTSHMVTQAIIAVTQIIIWNVILYVGFDYVNYGSPWLVIAFYLLMQLCGSSLGILGAQIFDEELYVLLTAIFFFTIFIYFGCVIFPIELMSSFWRYVSYVLPTSIPTTALRSVTVRGMGITHPSVWPAFCTLFGWMLVVLLCSVVAYKKFNR